MDCVFLFVGAFLMLTSSALILACIMQLTLQWLKANLIFLIVLATFVFSKYHLAFVKIHMIKWTGNRLRLGCSLAPVINSWMKFWMVTLRALIIAQMDFFFKEKFLGLRLGKNDSEFSFRKGSNILSPLGYSKF